MAVSFRDYLQTLRKHDELVEISKPVDLRNVAALVPQSEKALLFTNVHGYSMPVVSGLLQSRNRLALGMGVSYGGIEEKLRSAMERPIKPRIVRKAPVKEVILAGEKVDLYQLPVPIFSLMDGGPMITGAVVIAEDPEYGMNAGMYRLMLKEKNITGIDIVTPNNLRRYAERALQAKKPLPISIAIGAHPYEMMASTFKASLGTNELGYAGGLRGEPLALAVGETIPVPCIADAEIVLEGEILPEGWIHPEGPFCEFYRLMGSLHYNPRQDQGHDAPAQADLLRPAHAVGEYLDERADLRGGRVARLARGGGERDRHQCHARRLLPLAHHRRDQETAGRGKERDPGASLHRRHQARRRDRR